MGGCGCVSCAQKGPSSRAGHLTRQCESRSHAPRSGFGLSNLDPIRRTIPHLFSHTSPSSAPVPRPRPRYLSVHVLLPIPSAFPYLSPALFPAHLRHSPIPVPSTSLSPGGGICRATRTRHGPRPASASSPVWIASPEPD